MARLLKRKILNGNGREKTLRMTTIVDRYAELDFKRSVLEQELKSLKKEMEPLKQAIIEFFNGGKSMVLETPTHIATPKVRVLTQIPPEAFHSLLKKLGKARMFYDLVTVRVADAKKYIGAMDLSQIWTETETISGIIIKRK